MRCRGVVLFSHLNPELACLCIGSGDIVADNRAVPADYLFPLSRRIIAECAAVNQKRLSGRSCKPAAIQFFFRLAGPQKVPFSIYPNLDPGMVIVAVRPTRRVYLTCCKPDTAQCRHRKGGFFSAASFSAPIHRHRPRRSVIRHFIRCMLCAPVVDLHRCLIFVQSYNSVF